MFEHNIACFDQGELYSRPWQWVGDRIGDLKNNIYLHAGGQSFDIAEESWDQWRGMGLDNESSVIADLKFMDPAISASLPMRSSKRQDSSLLITAKPAFTAILNVRRIKPGSLSS